jgi:ACS family glucarate transporter-like MFS transporter
MTARAPRFRMRWVIFAFLLAFTIVAYIQRTAISVAAQPMMPQLGLSQVEIGWLETSFLISYTAFQFPGGVFGQLLGARRMLALCGAQSIAATLAIPLLPTIIRGHGLFVALLAAQFTLGLAQAPVFAVVSGALENWFPRRQWALAQGLSSSGLGIGAACAPLLISAIMITAGWRSALIIVGLPAIALVAAWWFVARDTPWEHHAVTAAECAELDHSKTATVARPKLRRIASLLKNWNLLGLSLSYLAMNVVFYLITFWSFLYLVQARHFTVLQGGLSAALPLLGGAAGAATGGIAGSALSRRFGPNKGLRIVPLIALPGSCVMLLVGVHAASATAALAALTLAFLLLETTEACFWAASMEIGGMDAVAAGGILNTGGNIGGIIATPIVAALSGGGNWSAPFLLGAISVLISAAIWLTINPGEAHTSPSQVAATI